MIISRILVIVGMSLVFSLLAVGTAAQSNLHLVGQTPPTPAPISIDYSNLTALGALIVTLLFIVCKMLPGLHDKFTKQSEIYAGSIAHITKEFTDSLNLAFSKIDNMGEKVSEIQAHCREHNAEGRD